MTYFTLDKAALGLAKTYEGRRHAFTGARCYNRTMKECPLCGEQMKLHVRQVQERAGSAARTVREWICPECDYFEEAEAGEV